MLIAHAAVRKIQIAGYRYVGVFGVVLFITIGALLGPLSALSNKLLIAMLCLAMGSIITGLVWWESSSLVTVNPILVSIGEASYSLYLIHFPVQVVLAKLFAPGMATFALMLVSSCIAGLMLHRVVERRILLALRPKPRLSSSISLCPSRSPSETPVLVNVQI
jgi:peptidoglycan/LPS O-acetylase OafA/YrhL